MKKQIPEPTGMAKLLEDQFYNYQPRILPPIKKGGVKLVNKKKKVKTK